MSRVIICERFHAQCRETNPTIATGTTARKAASFPPRADEGLIHVLGIAKELQLEVNPLHPVGTSGMGTVRIVVVDVW
jgi:hypothetical protein